MPVGRALRLNSTVVPLCRHRARLVLQRIKERLDGMRKVAAFVKDNSVEELGADDLVQQRELVDQQREPLEEFARTRPAGRCAACWPAQHGRGCNESRGAVQQGQHV